MPPVSTPTTPLEVKPVITPAPVNAFALLQQPKKKPVEVPAEIPADNPSENTPQAAEPKRRGRPPKKRKSSPPPSKGSHLPHEDAPSSPFDTGLDNSETPGTYQDSSAVPSTSMSTPGAESMDIEPSVKKDNASVELPKRVLRFNPKTGTIGSPPKPKESPPRPSKTKGKAASANSIPSPLVIPYPSQDPASRSRIGDLIESVLGSKTRRFPVPPQITPTKSAKGKSKTAAVPEQKQLRTTALAPTPKSTTTTTAKSTHPFFTGARTKGATKDGPSGTPSSAKSAAGGSGMNYYTSTPCSPKKRAPQPSAMFKMPQFGAKNGILRVPGARLPAWPWKGAVHVRPGGDISPSLTASSHGSISGVSPSPPPLKKRKGLAVDIRKDELILERKMQSLNIKSVIEDIKGANADEFAPPPPELRLPQRHIESGPKLQSRIYPQLRTNDPGLNALYTSISTTLSAFDQHQCESSSWAQKYAPSCAIEVLQSGQEPVLLKNWLEALKVVSVDTGSGEAADSKSAGAKGKTKKKRKKNKLDGFIVSSDDEDDGTGETSDNEADWSASGRYGLVKNTVVRSGSLLDKAGRAGARLTNAVVISGPHGCGKSAAVYAVAKELGFEVFEINASSRRSGKDVMDRIGDMTRNHLVQHKNKKLSKAATPAETSELVDDYDTDLEDADGEPDPDFPMPEVEILPAPPTKKQPTMSSFFKSTSGGAAKQAEPTNPEAKASQKQSLILLEEADLLYEEDKQFWATVMSLMAQSKRPFVITCNDETLLPLQSLLLHAIFRFTPPPTDVAVDRLIMIAACEGHAIQRKAVESLYEVRNHDFRAALAELQFWCQIGVGDRRGGFDWFYQRWPEGVDIDENGHVMRVVSSDTYQEGMGWLNNDIAAGKANTADNSGAHSDLRDQVEDDLVQQAWNDWQLDMGQWQDSLDLTSWSNKLGPSTTDNQRRHLLEVYDNFTETMSDADLVSSAIFTTDNRMPFDATQPELPYKAHEDYILGQQLLDRTTVAHELDDLRLPMATAIRCAAKQALHAETTTDDNTAAASTLDALNELRVVCSIRKEHSEPQGLVPSDTPNLRRIDLSLAFDPIAVPSSGLPSTGYYAGYFAPSASTTSSSHLDPSIFDRNMSPIVVDVAPFVRGIIAYEGRLQKQRQKTSSLFTENASTTGSTPGACGTSDSDGSNEVVATTARRRPAKRMRTTRAAMSALDWGTRSAVRKERWFDNADINPVLVMRTGGDDWDTIVEEDLKKLGEEAATADARDAAAAAQRAAGHEAATAAAAAYIAEQAAQQTNAAAAQEMYAAVAIPPQMVPPPSAVIDQGLVNSAPFTGVNSAPMGVPQYPAVNGAVPTQNGQHNDLYVPPPSPPHEDNNPNADS
ncbi:hypothetical protein SEUCBS140593_007747 [Sporothrix eucalyptigena]|uniref:AAA+ ATPase domain-containing protein n=1 Tax=Sporothrix eucalyptigena TaxID=1812306 RepID=A0ABP0CFP5_9PEZI